MLGDDYGGLVWIKYYDGSQTAADPMLRAKYGSHPDRPWTADMVGEGLCYAIMTFLRDEERLVQVPRYRFEMTGLPLYDIRRDSTRAAAPARPRDMGDHRTRRHRHGSGRGAAAGRYSGGRQAEAGGG